ncbi:chorismate-binding protein [Demequina aurantiaca]|uniref:chorismate-binding protein n=1 Tax=Demequina aurantiaca TaxID=676200 RepID=UPI003D341EA8
MDWSRDPRREGSAEFRGVRARIPVERIDVATQGARLSESGFWVLVAEFDGAITAWRFAEVERTDGVEAAPEPRTWRGPSPAGWATSMDRDEYVRGVQSIRGAISEGDVYQVNLCRVMSASLPAAAPGPDAVALSQVLATGNPARFASRIVVPSIDGHPGAWVVSASPELYLGIEGAILTSAPIKGTAAPGESMLPKDEAENVMITDLIRNDLSQVAVPGSVRVPEFLAEHEHPGLSHLQSTVQANLAPEFDWTPQMWPALLAGTFPPGSVSGAPKSSALEIIAREERATRGPYCGGLGWIDADARRAELAVGIRTFWWEPESGGTLKFGTGAGITWGSDPEGEWQETELKAKRLIALASTDTMAP